MIDLKLLWARMSYSVLLLDQHSGMILSECKFMSVMFNVAIVMLLLLVYLLFGVSIFSFLVFFFKQKTAYEMRISDWSSDVCSSDLPNCAAAACCGRCTRCAKPTTCRSRHATCWSRPIATCGDWRTDCRCCATRRYTRCRTMRTTASASRPDRKRVVKGKSVSVRVALGGSRIIKQKKKKTSIK